MPALERIYELALLGARPLLRTVAPFAGPKVSAGVAGREHVRAILDSWEGRTGAPLIWFHAPSVGESLMARAIIDAVRARADVQIAFSFFSPSAERVAHSMNADIVFYLPWDTPREMSHALERLQPACIAFVRTEVWPALTRLAEERAVRLALVNAVLPAGSTRLRGAARALLAPAYGRLHAVGAVTEEHARRYTELGVAEAALRVTGDARFDQVVQRIEARGLDPVLRQRLRAGAELVLVAGSTWPGDEDVLLPALARAGARVRSIIAPHEPTLEHIAALERKLAGAGMSLQRLAAVERGDAAAQCVIVDRLGVLADLYAAADVAWVGGGFHSAGVHSVVEPAAHGVPVWFGPQHQNAREAGELVERRGARVVTSPQEVLALITATLDDPQARAAAGRSAHAYVQSQLGGAVRNAELMLSLLQGVSSRSPSA